MSATLVSANTGVSTVVRAKARSASAVAGELANAALRILHAYGIAMGLLVEDLDFVLRALRVWITAEQLSKIELEVFDKSNTMALKWVLKIDYSTADESEDQYESGIDEIDKFLREEKRPKNLARYRFIMCFNVADPIHIPGWADTYATNDSHLAPRQVTSKLVGTKYHRASATYYGMKRGKKEVEK